MSGAAAAGKPNDGRMVFDALSCVLLLLVAILGAYMPKYLARRGSLQQGTASSLAFHLGNMLSGGVMLSAGFCHLLADALRQLAFVGRFPMAPFLSAVGYLITLLADQVVQLLTTDTEGRSGGGSASQMHSPYPASGYPTPGGYQATPGGVRGIGSSMHSPAAAGFGGGSGRPSPEPPSAFLGKKLGGFLRASLGGGGGGVGGGVGAGSKGWGYSKLEDLQPQQQSDQQGGSFRQPASGAGAGGIEMSLANGASHQQQHSSTNGISIVTTAAAPDGNRDAGSMNGYQAAAHQQQQPQYGCCHNPATCACCHSRGSAAAPLGYHNNYQQQQQQQPGPQAPAGFSRRPGSAGGLVQVGGQGVVSAARTRSLTNPGAVPALQQLLPTIPSGDAAGAAAAAAAAASASAEGEQAAAAAAGGGDYSGAAAAAAVLPVSTGPPALRSGFALHASTGAGTNNNSGCDDATCVLAAGSPRSVSAGGLHPRSSPKHRSAAGSSGGAFFQQQQQQQHNSEQLQRGSSNTSSIAQLLLQPVRQPSLPPLACGCCCGGGAAGAAGLAGCMRSGLPSAQPDMTEACTVARVAGHLELEVMSTTTGGHNHGHFQVFLSQRPLSFATSLLLACALCIHSILEGLALGAQQSMQATEDIMLAIAAHKGLAAYALGASIVESGASDSKFWVVVCLFAAATPLGITLGYASSVLGHGPVSAAMSALASGTFLYVALNEVIPKELEHPDGHRLAKVAALLLGFGLMSLLAVWA